MPRLEPSINVRLRVALAAVCLLLAACGGKPIIAPKVLTVELKAEPNINPSIAGRPSPVVVRVYELKTSAPFEAADFATLFEKDQSTLGADVVVRDEFVMAPGESRTLRRDLNPDSRVVAVMAAFRDLERAHWRAVLPIALGSDNNVALRLEASNVQLSRR